MIAFHVAQLLQAPQGTKREYDFVVTPEEFGDLPLAAPVGGHVTLTNLGSSILADAWYETVVIGECARCLEPARQPARGRLQEEFVPTVDVRSGAALRADPAEEAFPIDADHVLHLGEALRQHLVMSLPLQPLCRPDCQGLCPACGHDLNQGPCTCAADLSSSPFHALSSLLSDDTNGPRA